ncbi:Cell division septal protein FtsQ [Mariprofundus ferrinatatus]|uniref:Cell division septal protein FtsQ n=1 Tax=Mariprofundus ferrinatatus TaxID=1921087 RepID=A0A2K8LCQ6_9PROT|nr:cell division protein FtsQ/DivIB [Mariprofundus ferrinatatus]ATX82684.1 Cell division septal protein FtsQ [Mariprofundus ferrinatatus]
MSSSRSNHRRVDPELMKARRMRLISRIGKMFLFAGLTTATLATGWWLNGQMSVTSWKIEGEMELKRAIAEQLEAMENRDFLHTRPDLLRATWMQQQPDLAAVEITRVLPDALHIRAIKRVPVALWQDEKGELQLIDEKGSAYRALRRGESPDLPLLRVARDELNGAHKLLGLLAKHESSTLTSLSEIRAGSTFWQIYFSKGVTWKLPFGEERGSLAQLSTLLQQPRWRNRNWQIDARLQTRWYIRPARYGGVI